MKTETSLKGLLWTRDLAQWMVSVSFHLYHPQVNAITVEDRHLAPKFLYSYLGSSLALKSFTQSLGINSLPSSKEEGGGTKITNEGSHVKHLAVDRGTQYEMRRTVWQMRRRAFPSELENSISLPPHLHGQFYCVKNGQTQRENAHYCLVRRGETTKWRQVSSWGKNMAQQPDS